MSDQTPTPDTPEERERFEAWYRAVHGGKANFRCTVDGHYSFPRVLVAWESWQAAQARTLEGLTEEEPQKDRCARGLHTPDEWTGTDGKKHLTCVHCRELLGEEARLQRVAPVSTKPEVPAELEEARKLMAKAEIAALAEQVAGLGFGRSSCEYDAAITEAAALITAWASKQSPALVTKATEDRVIGEGEESAEALVHKIDPEIHEWPEAVKEAVALIQADRAAALLRARAEVEDKVDRQKAVIAEACGLIDKAKSEIVTLRKALEEIARRGDSLGKWCPAERARAALSTSGEDKGGV